MGRRYFRQEPSPDTSLCCVSLIFVQNTPGKIQFKYQYSRKEFGRFFRKLNVVVDSLIRKLEGTIANNNTLDQLLVLTCKYRWSAMALSKMLT